MDARRITMIPFYWKKSNKRVDIKDGCKQNISVNRFRFQLGELNKMCVRGLDGWMTV